MAIKAGNALREMWRKRYVTALDSIFDEHESNKILIGPDAAMDMMEELLAGMVKAETQNLDGPTSFFRFDFDAFRREAHHYAVDCFYKTYFPRKRGAPPLPIHHLDRILQLSRSGMNVAQIARLMKQRTDTIGKQLAVAEKRWQEIVEKIELVRHRSPHLVAKIEQPTSKRKKLSTSNRSTRKRRGRTRK